MLLVDGGPSARAAASITVVNTASQLRAATQAGAQDIEIRSHLDLTELALGTQKVSRGTPTALGNINGTSSIRVRTSLALPRLAASLYRSCASAAASAHGVPTSLFPTFARDLAGDIVVYADIQSRYR